MNPGMALCAAPRANAMVLLMGRWSETGRGSPKSELRPPLRHLAAGYGAERFVGGKRRLSRHRADRI